MKKISVAVCDADKAYGERLGAWLSLERKGRLAGASFSSPGLFLEGAREEKPDIVLLGPGFWGEEEVREAKEAWGKGTLWLRLHDGLSKEKAPEWAKGLPAVEKYQPAPRLAREILAQFQEAGDARETFAARKEMIGVYSPGHSAWQTPFALTLAQALGRKERTLYVSFQECAGFCGWFGEEYQRDLLDVMYLCLENEGRAEECIGSAAYTMEGVDYIPPAEDGVCLGEISRQDYQRFVRLLAEKSGYDVVILDFGMMLPGFFGLLGECSKAYILTEGGELSDGPLQQFKRMAKRQGVEEAEGKLDYLMLPPLAEGAGCGETWMQRWAWGELGDYARRLTGVQSGTD